MKFSYDFVEINGRSPMIECLDGLSVKERAKIFAYIDKLVDLKSSGMQPKENLSKSLGNGIFELRVAFESRISRSLYFYVDGRKMMFTHGFVKKRQKTPGDEIEKAITLMKAWRDNQ